MATYKLFYFPTRGRAEVIRMVFAVAEVPFEDIRVERSEWSKTKPDMLSGQMPELHFDGNKLPESRAIYRYLAKEHGLFGDNNLDAAKIDAVCCVLEDLMENVGKIFFAPDEATKEKLRHKFQNETCGKTLEKLENMLKQYNPDGKFFLGDKMTLADIIFVYDFHDIVHLACSCEVAGCLNEHPTLKKIYQNCLANANMSKWLNERPKEGQ